MHMACMMIVVRSGEGRVLRIEASALIMGLGVVEVGGFSTVCNVGYTFWVWDDARVHKDI